MPIMLFVILALIFVILLIVVTNIVIVPQSMGCSRFPGRNWPLSGCSSALQAS